MTILLYFTIGFATALLSGIFGLLGGMILMVILLTLLSLPAAMLLSALSQLVSNGWRCWLWREHIQWKLLPPYVSGMLTALLFLTIVTYMPDKAAAFFLMGALPLVAMALRNRITVTIVDKRQNFISAALLTVVQLTSGAVGPLLDLLYVQAPLTRQQIIATKALTQSGMHIMRLFYYGTFAALVSGTFDWPDDLKLEMILACILGVTLGTRTSVLVLNRMSDAIFRKWLNVLIILVSVYSLYQAAVLWWG